MPPLKVVLTGSKFLTSFGGLPQAQISAPGGGGHPVHAPLFTSVAQDCLCTTDKTTKADMVAEVAAALKKTSSAVTFQAVQDMPILESFVYEVFRCHPPVTVQHAMLKEDTVIQSNSGLYQLRAGDKLLGHCGFASRDPAVFDKPDTFNAKRFLGEGKAKIKNVLWSNGYQDVPYEETLNTKQCPGKDFVPLMVRVFMAHFLKKYKDVELTGKVGWSKTKIVPGPMLESYKLSGPELLVKSLTKV